MDTQAGGSGKATVLVSGIVSLRFAQRIAATTGDGMQLDLAWPCSLAEAPLLPGCVKAGDPDCMPCTVLPNPRNVPLTVRALNRRTRLGGYSPVWGDWGGGRFVGKRTRTDGREPVPPGGFCEIGSR